MKDDEYSIAYAEVLEILKYIPLNDYNKIPRSYIDLFKANANKNYSFHYEPSRTLKEQNVSKIARGIIAILFRDYWTTDLQRKEIKTKQAAILDQIQEIQNSLLISGDNIFDN